MACHTPKPQRLLRKVDNDFVRALKSRMKADPIAPGIPPLALLLTDSRVSKQEDFKPHLAGQYQYEVLGGLHSVMARQELVHEAPGMYVCNDWSDHLALNLGIIYLSYFLLQDIHYFPSALALCTGSYLMKNA